jgi:alpha-1,3-rhamnosyl/mannosyltransferase
MDGIAMTTERLRIIVDARYACDAYPGIGRVVSGMAQALAHLPDVAHLHLITNPRRTNTHLQLPATSVTVTHHHVSALPDSVAEGQRVRRLANTIAADWFYTPYLRLPWGRFVPRTMVTVHDAIPLQSTSTPWHVRIGFRLALWLVAARASLLTTVSDNAAAQIAPHMWPYRPPVVIPNGVDAQFFVPVPVLDQAAHGISGPYALCVSSNQAHKNLATLVAAWRILVTEHALDAGATLVIAGQFNPTRDCPWRAALDLPIIEIPNPDDVLLRQLYHGAQMVVQPSRAEGFGLPVYEALACGCAVLCSDLPVYRETVADAVVTTAVDDPKVLAQAIAALWNDPIRRAHLTSAGPPVARRFDWNAAAAQAIALMHKNTPGR